MISNKVTRQLSIPSIKNGVHIPHRSAVTPLRKRRNVPPPSWKEKIYPKTLPSKVSSVFSEIYENSAGNVRNVDTPNNIIIIMSVKMFVKIVNKNPIIPIVAYEIIMTFFLPINVSGIIPSIIIGVLSSDITNKTIYNVENNNKSFLLIPILLKYL